MLYDKNKEAPNMFLLSSSKMNKNKYVTGCKMQQLKYNKKSKFAE